MARKKKEEVKIEAKKRYVECPFCNSRMYKQIGYDNATTSCMKCGKRIEAIWKTEE